MKSIQRLCGAVVLSAASLLAVPAFAATVDVAGIKYEDSVKVANADLKLNGAGIRHKVIFKVYAAGLYLPKKETTVDAVLGAPGVKRVSLTMLRDVSNEEFGRGFMQGIHSNTDKAEKAKFVKELQKLGELFAQIPELKKGDNLTIDWVPGTGTVMSLNGKRVIEPLPEQAFYSALLKIWLGEKPVDNGLKRAMLGESDERRGN